MGNCLTIECDAEPEEEEIAAMAKALTKSLRGSAHGDRDGGDFVATSTTAGVVDNYSAEQLAQLRASLALNTPCAASLVSNLLQAARCTPADCRARTGNLAALAAVSKLSGDAFAVKQMVGLGLRDLVNMHTGHSDVAVRILNCVCIAFLIAYDQRTCDRFAATPALFASLLQLVHDAKNPAAQAALAGQPMEECYRAIACIETCALQVDEEDNGNGAAVKSDADEKETSQVNPPSDNAAHPTTSSCGSAQILPSLVLVTLLRKARILKGPHVVSVITKLLQTTRLPKPVFGEIAAALDDRLLSRPSHRAERAVFAEMNGVDLLSDTSQYDWSHGIRCCSLLTMLLEEGHAGLAVQSQKLFVKTCKTLHWVLSTPEGHDSEFSKTYALGRLLPALRVQGAMGVHHALVGASRSSLAAGVLTPCFGASGPMKGKQDILHQLIADLWSIIVDNPTVSMQASAVHALWAVGFGTGVPELAELVLQCGRTGGGLKTLLSALVQHLLYMHPSSEGGSTLDALLSVSAALHQIHLDMTVKDDELARLESEIEADIAANPEPELSTSLSCGLRHKLGGMGHASSGALNAAGKELGGAGAGEDKDDTARDGQSVVVDVTHSKHYECMSNVVSSLARGCVLVLAHLAASGPRAAALLNELCATGHIVAHIGDVPLKAVDDVTLRASLLAMLSLLKAAAVYGVPLLPLLTAAPLAGAPAMPTHTNPSGSQSSTTPVSIAPGRISASSASAAYSTAITLNSPRVGLTGAGDELAAELCASAGQGGRTGATCTVGPPADIRACSGGLAGHAGSADALAHHHVSLDMSWPEATDDISDGSDAGAQAPAGSGVACASSRSSGHARGAQPCDGLEAGAESGTGREAGGSCSEAGRKADGSCAEAAPGAGTSCTEADGSWGGGALAVLCARERSSGAVSGAGTGAGARTSTDTGTSARAAAGANAGTSPCAGAGTRAGTSAGEGADAGTSARLAQLPGLAQPPEGLVLLLRVMHEAADGELASPVPYMGVAAKILLLCCDAEAALAHHTITLLRERTGLECEAAVRAMLAELAGAVGSDLSAEPFFAALLPRRSTAHGKGAHGHGVGEAALDSGAVPCVRPKRLAFRCQVQHQRLHKPKPEESTLRYLP